MDFHCPACQRPLYNRRRPDCEFCGAAIPAALRLTEAQALTIDRLKAEEDKRYREQRLRDIAYDAAHGHLPGGL